MSSMKQVAEQFFDACETGKGWEVCQKYLSRRRHVLGSSRSAGRRQDA